MIKISNISVLTCVLLLIGCKTSTLPTAPKPTTVTTTTPRPALAREDITSLAALVVLPNTNQLHSVQVAWDRSLESIVTGYKVYYGVLSHNYTNNIDAGTNIIATVTNLYANTTYFFAVTAYNAQMQESPFSNEVNFTPFNTAPTNPPANLRVLFQLQSSINPSGPFTNVEGATITVDKVALSNEVFRVAISTTPIP